MLLKFHERRAPQWNCSPYRKADCSQQCASAALRSQNLPKTQLLVGKRNSSWLKKWAMNQIRPCYDYLNDDIRSSRLRIWELDPICLKRRLPRPISCLTGKELH
jgi:hypothetical protein